MANNRIKPSLEEMKTRITEIISTMVESELEKFQTGLEEWSKSNLGKREHARKDLSAFAIFWLGPYFVRYYIKNKSAGGLFLETNIPVTVGGTVPILFDLSDNEDPIQVEGKIVRIDPNGFGVKFNEPLTAL